MTTFDDTYATPARELGDDNIEDLLPSFDQPVAPATGSVKGGAVKGAVPAVDRALIRRIAGKVEELLGAPESHRKVLAHLLGSGTGAVDLAVAVLTAPRLATRIATDLFEVADADPMEAGLVVATLPKERSKALWALLVALNEVTGTPPASDIKAALAIAKAAKKLSPANADLLQAAVALGKRS